MTIQDCLARAVRDGGMDVNRARRVFADYQQTLSGLSMLEPAAAQVEAARRILRAARKEAVERRRTVGLTAAAAAKLTERLRNHRAGPGEGLKSIIEEVAGSGDGTLAGQYQAVRRRLRRGLSRFIAKHRASLVGTRRSRASMDNVVREAFGKKTLDPEAGVFARAWAESAETARLLYNAAGGRIPKRADWGLPQEHHARSIAKDTEEVWTEFLLKRLDLDGMIDDATGLAFTRQSIAGVIHDAREAILSDGWSKREASGSAGRSMANRRLDSRFFKFKSPEAWLEYQKRYGSGDAFRTMVGHLDHMARDIAEMDILGPNPPLMIQHLKQTTTQIEARARGPEGIARAEAANTTAQNMFDIYRGTTQRAASRTFARSMSAARQYITSAVLGQAVITSLTDFNSGRVAARMVGMNQLAPMKRVAQMLASKEMRVLAAESDLIFENAVNMGHAAGRFAMEDLHIEAASRMADFTIRASGLGHLTEVSRQAFGMEFMSFSAKNTALDWRALDKGYRAALERYGINESDWAKIRTAKKHTAQGVTLLRSEEIGAVAGQRVADRWVEMITSLQEFAVPTASIRGKALVLGGTRPGTIPGEFMRSFFQFKSFPVTVMVNQGRMIAELNRGMGFGNALGYAAHFLIGMTIMGAIALQLKEVAKGRDPRRMDTIAFWGAALLQGGGLGLVGDFFFSDQNRFGMNAWEQAGGPVLSLAGDLAKLTIGNVQQLALGEDTDVGNDLLRFARRYTPGGSLWQVRLVYEREVLDQIQLMIDPKARRRFKARERTAARFDTQFYWRPGRSALQGDRIRAPSLSGITGG